jgi:hypothetical protein
MVSALCSVHNLKSGRITIACDNISALNATMDVWRTPKITDAEFDLIYAIKNRLSILPISVASHHLKGHQDATMPMKDLDHWSLLNIEMDRVAKEALPGWTESLFLQRIEGKPWSVWYNETKIVNDLDSKLYDIMHAQVYLIHL